MSSIIVFVPQFYTHGGGARRGGVRDTSVQEVSGLSEKGWRNSRGCGVALSVGCKSTNTKSVKFILRRMLDWRVHDKMPKTHPANTDKLFVVRSTRTVYMCARLESDAKRHRRSIQ